jgi:hypothetical protein
MNYYTYDESKGETPVIKRVGVDLFNLLSSFAARPGPERRRPYIYITVHDGDNRILTTILERRADHEALHQVMHRVRLWQLEQDHKQTNEGSL